MPALYRLCWYGFRALFRLYFRWRVYHPERVPPRGPAILAANHASFLDPPLIGAAAPRNIHYLARESLFRFPGAGRLLRYLQAVPVDRDGGGAAGLKAILDRLQAGAAILMFPEGTRTPDGQLHPARAGIGLAIIKSSAPVIPIRVFGTFQAWGRHLRWPRPRPVAIKFGEPLDFTTLRTEAKHCSRERLKALYQQAADEVMNAIAKLNPGLDAPRAP